MRTSFVLFEMAIRNLVRHRTRSLITLSSIAFGCVSLIFVGGYFANTYDVMRESFIRGHTGHFQIYRQGYLKNGSKEPFGTLIENQDAVLALIRQWKEVKEASPELHFSGLISNRMRSVPFFGEGRTPFSPHIKASYVNPNALTMMNNMNEVGYILQEGDFLREEAPFSILLGKGLADGLGVKTGDPMTIMAPTVFGSLNALDVSVGGIFITSAKDYDNRVAQLSFKTVATLLQTEEAQMIRLLLHRTQDTRLVAEKLNKLIKEKNLNLEFKNWRQLNDYYTKTEDLLGRMFLVLRLVVALIVIISIYNTMNMSVLERIGEVGTLRAIGTKQKRIFNIFLVEGAVLGVLGGLLGVLLGALSTSLIGHIGIPMPTPPGATVPWISRPEVVPTELALAFVLAVLCALLSSILPGKRATSVEVAEALRHAN